MSVIVNGIKFTQISNGHVMGVKGGRMVFHAQQTRMMNENELKEYAEETVRFMESQHGYIDTEKNVVGFDS